MANLFYIMGASGVGKDTLLQYVSQRLPMAKPVIFAHRYITRPAHAGGENHVALTEVEFQHRLRLNCFAMHWQSHGNHYGIGVEINHWRAMGLDVVINGSRAYFQQAIDLYPKLTPILITASQDTLRQRLKNRGRESAKATEKRLQRAQEFEQQLQHPNIIRICNDGVLEDAGDKLMQIIGGVLLPA